MFQWHVILPRWVSSLLKENCLSIFFLVYKNLILHALFSLCFAIVAFAQKDNVWIFNNNGIHKIPSFDFHFEPPELIEPASTSNSPLYGFSACNIKGDLIFYSGNSDWTFDANNKPMPNGNIPFFIDSIFTCMNAVVQIDSLKYLIFFPYTSSDSAKNRNYIFSSVIDMKLNNGKGDYDLNSKMKIDYTGNSKLIGATDVLQINKYEHWYLIRSDSFFLAFHIKDGKVNAPVISRVNEVIMNYFHSNWNSLKFSNDGKKIVFTGFINETFYVGFPRYAYIYDFDSKTGKVSNGRVLDSVYDAYYTSCVFSPNDSFIFLSSFSYQLNPSYSWVSQIKRYTPKESFKMQSPVSKFHFGRLKLGPNSRIYCLPFMLYGRFAVLQYPDSFANFKFYMPYGLEMFNPVYYLYSTSNIFKRVSFKIFIDTCHNQLRLKNFSHPDYIKFNWYVYKDSILIDSFKTENAKVAFSGTGKYYIKIKATDSNGYYAWYSDTIQYSDNYSKVKADFEADTNIWCANVKLLFKDKSSTQVINPKKGESWQWFFGDNESSLMKNPEHIYSKSGIYTVKLVYSNGYCYDTIQKKNELTIIEAPRPGFKMSQTHYCSPYLLQITDTSLGKVQNWLYEFGDGSDTNIASPAHLYSNAGNYKIVQTLTGPTGCVTKDSAILHLRKGFSGKEEINSLTSNVIDNQSVLINWQNHPDAFRYSIFKSDDEVGFYHYFSQTDTFYKDIKVKPAEKVYSYKITGMDSCSRPSADSRVMKNILLTGITHENEYAILNWTAYELWQNGVKEYILEYQDSTGVFQPIVSSPSGKYTDLNFFSSIRQYEKCYRIRAIENAGNQQQSLSNVLCLPYTAVIWIPNAFSPNADGLNDTFSIKGISIKDFNLRVFDRWGSKIFESNSIYEGWDGKYGDRICPAGIYSFQLNIRLQDGKNLFHSGTIHLIR